MRGRRIGFNTGVNLLGQGIPIVAAVVLIPRLIAGLGTDRFGILTLAWVVIGYFSLFDLGLARALTQIISERLGRNDTDELSNIVWTALGIMTAMGCLGGLLASVVAPEFALHFLKIPPSLRSESVTSFYILATSIPLVIATAGFVGILTAFERFGLINAVRVPLGISNYLVPVLLLSFSHSLVWITCGLVLTRVLSGVVQFAICLHVMPSLRSRYRFYRQAIGPLFRFGGWMSVSNVVGPMMIYMDRFLIGAVVSVSAVAWYATPYEMVTKLLIVSGALTSVVFPAFAARYLTDTDGLMEILSNSWKALLCAIFLPVLLIVAFAGEGLSLWLDPEFALHSGPILRWLAIGVFANSFAQIIFALVQSAGRPDLTAKLHLAELAIYLPILWWSLKTYGAVGAAVIWTLRVVLDGGLLLLVAERLIPKTRATLTQLTLAVWSSGACFLAVGVARSLESRIEVTTICLCVFVLLAWHFNWIPDNLKRVVRQLLFRSAVGV